MNSAALQASKLKQTAMAKSSATPILTIASPTIQINDMSDDHLTRMIHFLNEFNDSDGIPDDCKTEDFHSDFVRSHLRQPHIERGRVSCILSVKPSICNGYRSLHGGCVAAVADIVSIACARTVVAENKDIFLGELSISYLSGAPQNAEVVIDASVIRSGRNLTVVAVEFKLQSTGKLIYTARSTFYNMPVAKL